ncbi:LamB/YcsF family protein [Lacunisphaera limnophila]|uniref:LamB/YcsF family protein n=1 Tax=Lacunisphaera limnophila TaxID=1838286 RepID=A0A1D8AZB2_9BACT|nr:5-oxoprolinase subunit PxpA [Lacunisphaera limnophila]AOS46236.1 LamB/YcsF family protein [Lacunisphaera limnophila]
MPPVDLNGDLGEGGGHDAALMPFLTSVNIACGAHAGDVATMWATVALAQRHGVAVGAHPGFADPENFGRREWPVTPQEAAALVQAQVKQLQGIAGQAGVALHHVKLHGALYNQVSRDRELAAAVVQAVREVDKNLRLYALAGSELVRAAQAREGLVVVSEVFADRTYQADGTLTPRDRPDALIRDEAAAVAQVLRLIRTGRVRATDGTDVALVAGTICLHGDGADPVGWARGLSAALRAAGIEIRRPGA